MLAWSGGKDAAWALHVLRQDGRHDVVALLSTVAAGRSSMQGVAVEVLRAQAAAAGLPLLEAGVPPGCDNATYEAVVAEALSQAQRRWPGLRSIAFGDLSLEDVRAWRQRQFDALGWHLLTPLFGRDTASLAREMQAAGLQARVCCVDTRQLDAGFAGRRFDAALLADLPPGVDPCGEHGEFHTCVTDGPMFDRPLQLEEGARWLDDGRFARIDFMAGR